MDKEALMRAEMCRMMEKQLRAALLSAGYQEPIEITYSESGIGEVRVHQEIGDGSFGTRRSPFNGWPLIWKVCEQVGVGWGCGNHNQHQISLLQPWQEDIGWGKPGKFIKKLPSV